MKYLIAMLMVLVLAGAALAWDDCRTLVCPDVQVTCNCNEVVLPGLWEVTVLGETKCGEITVVGSGFILNQGEGRADFFLSNRLKRAKQVETCGQGEK